MQETRFVRVLDSVVGNREIPNPKSKIGGDCRLRFALATVWGGGPGAAVGKNLPHRFPRSYQSGSAPLVGAFRQEMRTLGWIGGKI